MQKHAQPYQKNHLFSQKCHTTGVGVGITKKWSKQINPVEEILGNGMRETIRRRMNTKYVRMQGEVIDKATKSILLKFRLNPAGYVVDVESAPAIEIWVPHEATRKFGDFWEVEEETFRKACEKPLSDLRQFLIHKKGLNPKLVNTDVVVAWPRT